MKAVQAFVMLVLATMCSASERPRHIEELFATAENFEIVAQPDRIEACILHRGQLWFTRNENKRRYSEGKSVIVAPEYIPRLIATLTSEATYVWDEVKACMPTWNARLKFYRGGHCISADFCFGCDILVLFRDGRGFSGGNFDNGSDAIFHVIRSLFPRDKVVQEIADAKRRRDVERTTIERLIEEKKRANQALELTIPAVTIPAAQKVAPAGVVAHLLR